MRIWITAAVVAVVALLGYWVIGSRPQLGVPVYSLDHGRPRPQGDCYVIAFPQPLPHLNPLTSTDAVARRSVLAFTHDALLDVDPATGELRPSLAESWQVRDAGLTLVFQLRQGVCFADGQPLTMADVMFTDELRRGGPPAGAMWSGLALVSDARAVGERELHVALRRPYFAAAGIVGTSWKVVQRAFYTTAVAELSDGELPEPGSAEFAAALLEVTLPGPGTGPYQLARDASGAILWRRGEELDLAQNPLSWRRQARPEDWNLAGIKLLCLPDAATRRAQLRQQAIDFLELPDPQRLLAGDEQLAAHYRPVVYGYATLGPQFIVWNHDRPELGRAAVRRALTMLIDRAALAKALAPRAIAAGGWFRPTSDRIPRDLDAPAFDVEAAAAALRAAGVVDDGKTLQLSLMLGDLPEHDTIYEILRPAFAAAGVTLVKDTVAPPVLFDRLRSRDFDAFLFGWNSDLWNDPYEVFDSSQRGAVGHNWMGYHSDAMDDVLERARVELSAVARRDLYRQFCRIFAADQPVSILFHQRIAGVLHRRFQGAEVGALGLVPERWWVEPDDQRW